MDLSNADPFYRRFTVEGNKNLILGSSRAARAFNPDKIFQESGLNFSFTMSISPYGETYFKAIQKMCKEGNGTVVMEVCPIIFSEDEKYLTKESRFRENKLMLGNMYTYDLKVNDEYMVKNFEKPLYQLIYFKDKNDFSLEKNGWLHFHDTSKVNYEINLKNNLNYFEELNKRMKKCQIRIDWFKKTIEWLKVNHKKVILVRTPIATEMLEMENKNWPDFNEVILQIADNYNVKYFDFSTDLSFRTQDGSHLGMNAANSFSTRIGEFLKQLKSEGK